jgi:copper chaperone CopZ
MKLRTTGADSWGNRNSSDVKFVASAIVEEAVTASQSDSGAPAEGLSMYFKAEGSLNENNISKVTKVLEETEGVSQVKVYVLEGAATVELVKQTDIQATGVASSLVQLIETAGFKMQALSLGFDGDEAEDDDYIDYAEEEATTE